MRELVEKYDVKEFHVEYNDIDNTFDLYKKTKRVKVDFSVLRVTQDRVGGDFYAVRFKIENYDWTGKKIYINYKERDFGWLSVYLHNYVTTTAHAYLTLKEPSPLYIGKDAQDRWSTPVIFTREQREKLQDLVKYLEEKLNAS